ncbi:MAG: Ig-like domain-containing protein [Candidatus Enterosoma sp.]|nr:Ig-like domain-containing protein [bacterium]MDY5909594.1 Ig-like domain-containing protein [Candidatus Enterosoma sp.]
MKKKIGLLTLALLSFGLVACGGESTPTEGPATDTPTEQPTEKPTETPVVAVLTINVSGAKKVGEVITFVAFLNDIPLSSQNDVTYTCSDAEAMEINGNKATLLKAGTFTVNAAHKNGAKASVELTIEEGQKLLTIAEAKKAADGTLVHIQGKITASAGKSAFIADETGGMYIYNWWSGSDDTAVNNKRFTAGDSVDMVAQVSSYNSAKQLISYTNNAAIDGCYAKKLDTEVDSMTPINLNETVLKSLTKASIGDVYTFEAAYVSEKTQGGLHTVTLKIGETTLALASSGDTSKDYSYDPDFDDLKVRFDALQLEEGDVIKVTTPFASVYNGAKEFAFFSQGTKFERVTPLTVKTVTIDGEETRNLVVGGTLTLTAAVAPSSFTGGVTWSSDHPEIASVTEGGVVTAVAAGTATITATSVDNPAVSDTVTINVTAAAVPATSVTLDKTEATLYPSQTTTLTTTIAPENTTDTITWTSSDADVATVADGVVTAVGAGTATITAKANDEAFATCTITVKSIGTETAPLSVTELKALADELIPNQNDNFSQTVYVTGTISKITTAFSSEHGNISFNISDGTSEFLVYRAVATSETQFLVGDTVVVSGTLTNYRGTKEFAANCVATTKARGTTTITVTGAENATVTGLPETAENGSTVSFSVAANEGYVLGAVKAGDDVLTADESGNYSFVARGGAIAITIETNATGSVSLDKETATVKIGETITLVATVNGSEDTSVTWSTSADTIATVADGVVTGVAAGTATITATSVADPTKSASCVVTVLDPATLKTVTLELNNTTVSGLPTKAGTSTSNFTTTVDETTYSFGASAKVYCNNATYVMFNSKNGDAYIYNKTAFGTNILSIEILTGSGASDSAKYAVEFASSENGSALATAEGVNVKKNETHVFNNEAAGMNYFQLASTNSGANGQISKIVITYTL